MTIDDARLVMLKTRKLHGYLMESYDFLRTVGNAYDKSDPAFIAIVEAIYECVIQIKQTAQIINRFATTKTRNPKNWRYH